LRLVTAAFVSLLCACAAGCSDIGGPQWFAPGTDSVQRTRAQRFDPYPDPSTCRDDGSARPRDYLHPPPEADVDVRSLPPRRPINMPERWQSVGN